jgi:hypothetical protein
VEIAKLLLGEYDPKLYEFSAETQNQTQNEIQEQFQIRKHTQKQTPN